MDYVRCYGHADFNSIVMLIIMEGGMGIFILLFWYQCLAQVVLKPRIAFLNFLECIKVVKYAVKIMLECAL